MMGRPSFATGSSAKPLVALLALAALALAVACEGETQPATPVERAATAVPAATATPTPGTPVERAATAVPAAASTLTTGTPGERYPDQGNTHIEPGAEHPPYNTVPATSGWHYPVPIAPAPWGGYAEPLPDEVLVHNLEHGGIGVHYNCPSGCADLVEDIVAAIQSQQRTKIVLSPYPAMPTRIALTAWNYLDAFDEFDRERITAFIAAHESSPNAPEYNVP